MVKRAFLFSVMFISILMAGVFIVFNSMALRDFAKRLIVTQSYYQFGIKLEVDDVRISYFRPAIRIKGIKLIHEYQKNKIDLSANEAVVYFNVIKLVQGKVGISGFRLKQPNADIVAAVDLSEQDKKLDIKEIWGKIQDSDVDRLRIDDGKFRIKLINGGKEEFFGFEGLDVNLRKGIISNFIIELGAENVQLPIRQIQGFNIRADIRNEHLKVSRAEIKLINGELYFGGLIRDFAEPSKMFLNLTYKLDLDLSKINSYDELIKKPVFTDFKKGILVAGGRFSWRTSENIKNASADISLNITELGWDDMNIPRLELRAGYSNKKAFISKLDISDGERSISANDTHILVEPPYTISGKGEVNDIELSRYLELFNIKRCLSNFYVEGPFTFTGSIYPELKIRGDFDLGVRDFWVVKQKGLELNKENTILDFKKGSVNGKVDFSTKGAYFDNFKAYSESNLINVNGWITADSTVDIDVKASDFSMDVYGRVEDLPVHGKGSFKTKLIVDESGDFKTQGEIDFKDVKLMHDYKLGSVLTKISYVDEVLSFPSLRCRLGSSSYGGNIDIIFGNDNEVSIKGRGDFKNAYTEDLYEMFNEKDKIFGEPSALINGSIRFQGRPSWDSIKMDFNLDLSDIEFSSERFDKLYADFVWDKGDVLIDDLYLLRGKSRFDFEGSRKKGLLTLSVSSNKVDISDISLISSRAQVDGSLTVKGQVKHYREKLSGNVKFNFVDLMMGQEKLKPISADLLFGDKITAKFNVFNGAALGDVMEESKGAYRVQAKLNDLDAFPLSSMFIDADLEPFETALNGWVDLVFDKNSGIKRGKIDLESLKFKSGFVDLNSKSKVFIEYNGGAYNIKDLMLLMDYEGGQCQLGLVPSGKTFSIKGCVPASSLRIFKEYIVGARGKVDVDLRYGEKLNGSMSLRDVALTSSEHRLGTINAVGKIPVENDNLKLNTLSLNAGGATASFSGSINISNMLRLSSVYPSLSIKAKIDKLYLEYPEGLKGKWAGSLELLGAKAPYSLNGMLNFYDGTYRKDIEIAKIAMSKPRHIDDSTLFKKKKPLTVMDIKLKTSDDVYVKNTTMTGDVAFDLNIKGPDTDPKLIGSVDLLRGSFIYFDNTFDLISGRVRFRDDDIEPLVYQLDSESRIGNYQVFLKLLSDRGEPKFSVSSTPPLTEEKILTLLATGDVQSDFMDQSGFTTGTGGNIVSEGLGVTGSIKKNIGVGMRLKTPSKADSSIPDIEFQKDLTNDLKVIYGKSLDENTNKQEVNVQYDLNRNVQLKLLFEEENDQNASQDKPSNAGVDIKFKFDF